MKIRFWGTRGSIPSPLKPADVEGKIRQAIRAIWQKSDVDTTDLDAVLAAVGELPHAVRSTAGGNTPCVEVQAAGETLIIDAGSGIFQLGLNLMDGPCGRGQCTLHLLMSHCHWDHIQGFPMFMPAFVPGNRIFVYGVHDVEAAFERQQNILTWPVSLSYMQAEKTFIKLQPQQAFSIGRVNINTLLNNHRNDAYSYRLEDQHSALVYATDAEYKRLDDASLQPRIEFFKNADALIFDSQYTLKEVWQMRMDFGHSSAMIGVDLARAAGVRKLILFHHDPTYSDFILQEIHARALAYQSQQESQCPTCEILLAYEGLTLDLAPPDAVALQLLAEDDAAILTPSSVFDERGVDQLAQQLTRLSPPNTSTRSILDLSQVDTLTTAGLKSLIALQQERKEAPIVLAAPSDKVRQVIELGGYSDFFAVYASVDAALTAVQAREVLDLPGQTIKSRYQIQSKIGAGRLGIVLKAVDNVQPVSHPNHIVALKILYPSFSDNTIDRFMRQSEQIVNLGHPNIVKVFAWDRDERYAFKVEEFISGQTLQSFIDGPRLSVQEDDPETESAGGSHSDDVITRRQLHSSQIINIAFDVIRALEYAHSRGVIHGDLKPQNIFLTEEGAKLSGFGLGRLQEGRNLLDVPMLFLTAAYLAPEQILGQPLDARSDLYAFGVILYQLFTGELPFEGSNREVMQSHLRRAPRRPREINPQLSISLEHVILKLMAQNPNDRYASALQVRRILSSMLVSYSGLAGGEDTTRPHWRPIVGREKQVRALRACWDDVLAGRGQLAFISGEPGVGKTTLAQHVAAQVRPPVLLTARCQGLDGGPAYQLFTELLQNYFATVPPEFLNLKTSPTSETPSDLEIPGTEDIRQLLGNFTHLIPEIKQMLPDLPNPSPLGDAQQEQLRLMSSLTHFIKRATQERPWFLILDDLQWADSSSLQLLRDLAHHLPSMALMIIGIYSDVELEPGHPLMETLRDLRSHPTYRHFPLERLTHIEVNQLLTYIWQRPVPEVLSDKIYQHTDGNPFYVEEVAKGLVDEGVIPADFSLGEEAAEQQYPDLEELQLPQSVREAVWRHIGHLSSDTQMLLRQAAVLGQTFRLDDLQEVSGLSEWEVLEHLDTALERQLIEEVPGNDTRSTSALRFCHTEIQYVLYEDLGVLRRRMLHRQAGEALERRVGSKTERVVAQLSRHFNKAGELQKATRYAFEAARLAHVAHDNDTALLWYRRALEMLEDSGLPQNALESEGPAETRSAGSSDLYALRLSAHESLGEVLDLVGRYDEALEHYAEARKLINLGIPGELERFNGDNTTSSEATGALTDQIRHMANLCRRTAEVYYNRSEYELAFEWLKKGLDYLNHSRTGEAEGPEAARIYLLGAWLYHRQSKRSEISSTDAATAWAKKASDIALAIDKPVGRQILAHAYRLLGGIDARRGNFSNAVRLCRESVRLYREIEDRVGLARAYNNLAVAYYNQGDWAKASDAYHESLVIRRHVGDIYGQAIITSNLAEIHRVRGAWDRAAELYEQSMAIWKQIDVRWGEALTLNDRALLHIYQGELEEARDCLTRSQAIFTEVGSQEYLPELERHWAELYLESGELEHALAHIQDSIAYAITQHSPLEEGISWRVLGEIHMIGGRYELAEADLRHSLEILTELRSEYEIARTKVSLARLSLRAEENGLRDSIESAQSYLEQAMATFEKLGARADLTVARDFAHQFS